MTDDTNDLKLLQPSNHSLLNKRIHSSFSQQKTPIIAELVNYPAPLLVVLAAVHFFHSLPSSCRFFLVYVRQSKVIPALKSFFCEIYLRRAKCRLYILIEMPGCVSYLLEMLQSVQMQMLA